MRNSWGTHYGESGFVRVIRGINNIAIEADCAWATPKDTWTNGTKHITTEAERNDPRNKPQNSAITPKTDLFMSKGGCRVPKVFFEKGEKPLPAHAWEEIDASSIPENWDWRSVNGTNYVSWSKN